VARSPGASAGGKVGHAPDDAAEKHGALVHKGDCEEQWGSTCEHDEDELKEAE